jgi:hypothetical protein
MWLLRRVYAPPAGVAGCEDVQRRVTYRPQVVHDFFEAVMRACRTTRSPIRGFGRRSSNCGHAAMLRQISKPVGFLAGNNIGTEAVVRAQRGAIGTPVRTATPHVDQNRAPNNFLVNDPWWSTQGIGGSCGR